MSKTVAKTDDSVTQNSENTGAQDELDSLLAEFDSTQEGEQKETKANLSEVVSYINEQRQREASAKVTEAIDTAINTVRESAGDAATNLPKWAIRGKLEEIAASDPRVKSAFENRDSNPAAWKKILQRVGNEIKDEFSIDTEATNDKNEVVAAVRGATSNSSKPGTQPDLGKMSDSAFNKYLAEEFQM